ncbi:MAG: hypothetical protein QOD80_127 [Verrucomicrobiota bacterium]
MLSVVDRVAITAEYNSAGRTDLEVYVPPRPATQARRLCYFGDSFGTAKLSMSSLIAWTKFAAAAPFTTR